MTAPLPWQASQWSRVQSLLADGRLPHALLLHGPAGTGKFRFAEALRLVLVCVSDREPRPCGQCRGCALAAAGSHPESIVVGPDEGKQDITVAQVRTLIGRATLTRQISDHRGIVIAPAEKMNPTAANSLLKTLEEPPPGNVFILVSSRPNLLLPTIRSRCQQFRFPVPDRADAVQWLVSNEGLNGETAAPLVDAAQGAPLLARELLHGGGLDVREEVDATLRGLLAGRAEPLAVARAWGKLAPEQVIYWNHVRIVDLIKRAVTGDVRLEPASLYGILDAVTDAERLHAGRGNPNVQLLLETLALAWSGNVRSR